MGKILHNKTYLCACSTNIYLLVLEAKKSMFVTTLVAVISSLNRLLMLILVAMNELAIIQFT